MIIFFQSCHHNHSSNHVQTDTLRIFHAGSLSQTFQLIKNEFEKRNTDILVLTTSCGSKQCVRNIIDLHKNWDIFFSADISLIDSFLVPEYADKSYPFITNSMVIAYTSKSKYASIINQYNWHELLQKDDVRTAFSDPASDPCGVRAISVLKLAEIFYSKPNLVNAIRYKQSVIERPKEVDLITLLELGEADYTIIYKSVAVQHNLLFIELSDSLDLGNNKLLEWYNKQYVSYNVPAKGIVSEPIQPILYGYCINKQRKDKKGVQSFYHFLQSDSLKQWLLLREHEPAF